MRDGIARVVGGTAPDLANRPRWFSGADTGDGSGVAGLTGCYSTEQGNITNAQPAVGMVLAGSGQVHFPAGGADSLPPSQEYSWDAPRLLILVPRQDPETEDALLTPFQDSVRASFRSHMTLYGAPNVYQAYAAAWRQVVWKTGGADFIAWEFTIRVLRVPNVTYTP